MMAFFAPGTVVAGRYEVESELGRGGAAVVYAARDRQVGTAVALKVLVPPPAVAHLVRERTRREILAVRALAHPNVVPIFDLLESGPWTVLVMERVFGSDLQALVAARGPLPARAGGGAGPGRGRGAGRRPPAAASCTATSSPATSWSTATDARASPTSGPPGWTVRRR